MSENSAQSIDPGSVQLWAYDATDHDSIGTRSIGFWLYMMSDAMIFAALFAAHGTYLHNYAGGPTAQDVIHFTGAAWETLFLFASVLAYGFGMVALKRGSCTSVVKWLFVSFATAFASSVFPTPVGPRKIKLPIGRLGFFSPALVRRIAFVSLEIASS